MSRIPARTKALVACATLAITVAACGAPDPSTAGPDSGPDLFQALPAPASAPALPPAAAPAPSTTQAKPAPKPAATPKPAGPVRVAAAAPAPSSSQWRPVAGDEFNAPALDTGTWRAYNSAGGFGNGYRRPEAISQSDGTLKITARGDVSGGMRHTFGQLYGRWEFRVRTDPGRGFGPAILLWPDSEQWPEDGEVDIMEVPGENRDLAHFIVHWGAENHVHGAAKPGNYAQWHTFAVEWLPGRLTGYIDGVKSYETTDAAAIPTKPMHLTIQLDQGPKKDWIAEPDETTPAEINLEVDWVRVFAPATAP